ncbi:cysteine desulfurase [Sneathiella marina]|uniref:Cysteine desulfurase n=1 Tax=Sneathiella marina TaxID=2950108 RepID=A0ABY4VZ05_9PROT|nr:cysteine desulfurase family protein [Sneathiella marina]USG59964.1 cysteine desulfurase [Sneathiella marina]
MTNIIYLDFNATAPIRPEVIAAMVATMEEGGNPSSVHQQGRSSRNKVEEARRQIAGLINCKAPEIIFTSGGTEANNFALSGLPNRQLMISATEHDSILSVALAHEPVVVRVDHNGLADLSDLEAQLQAASAPVLVSVMMANNETGVIQPVKEIAQIVHRYEALLHCDAIQAVAKIPVDFKDLGVDMMSISAHKFGGPQGMGALVLREGVAIEPVVKGGGQELGRRAGTENVAGIVGFGVAAALADARLAEQDNVRQLRDGLERAINDVSPGAVIYGADVPRLPNTVSVSMPGVPSELQVMNFDLAGVAVSAGSACSSGKVKASHVLMAMGVPEGEAGTAIRISLGPTTAQSDIDALLKCWTALFQRKSTDYIPLELDSEQSAR